MELLAKFLRPAFELIERQPTLALALGGAFAAVFLAVVLGARKDEENAHGLATTIFRRLGRTVWALVIVGLLAGATLALRSYLTRSLAEFRHTHGRVTEVNFYAVRSIWGGEQQQGELAVELGYDEEEIERLESEDPTKPTVTRKRKVFREILDNPFVRSRHEVTVRQNPRKKGSAVYAGYETDCRFTYHLKNPADRDVKATLRFPLPSERSMFTDLTVKLNGQDAMGRLQVRDGALTLEQPLTASETFDLEIAFKSRGLAHWYFQVREPREIRDFKLTLRLPDLPKERLNYPEGCMTPTEIAESGGGTVLTYTLDRALSSKGMGVEMPKQKQPGETTDAMLAQTEKSWVLLFAALLLGLTLGENAQIGRSAAVKTLVALLLGAAVALGYGLLGDLTDSSLGFAGAFVLLVLLLVALGGCARRALGGFDGVLLWGLVLLFGAALPLAGGLDGVRQVLYLNLCAFILLAFVAWQLLRKFREARD